MLQNNCPFLTILAYEVRDGNWFIQKLALVKEKWKKSTCLTRTGRYLISKSRGGKQHTKMARSTWKWLCDQLRGHRAFGTTSNILFQRTILEASILKNRRNIWLLSGILDKSAARKQNPKEVYAYLCSRTQSLYWKKIRNGKVFKNSLSYRYYGILRVLSWKTPQMNLKDIVYSFTQNLWRQTNSGNPICL